MDNLCYIVEYQFWTLCERHQREFHSVFFITAEVPVNYAIKVSINGGDEFDTRDRIMNSSKDIVCKLISHIPVIMVTLGDKGLLVCIMYILYVKCIIILCIWIYKLEEHTVQGTVPLQKILEKKNQQSFVIKISKRFVFGFMTVGFETIRWHGFVSTLSIAKNRDARQCFWSRWLVCTLFCYLFTYAHSHIAYKLLS